MSAPALQVNVGSTCTCFWVDPKYWTTHYGAVEPGSMMEPNPDCVEHFPPARVEWCGNIQTAYAWGLSLTEWFSLSDFERATCRRTVTTAPRFKATA